LEVWTIRRRQSTGERRDMMSQRVPIGKAVCLVLLITLGVPLRAFAVGSGPVSVPSAPTPNRSMPAPAAPRSAEAEYNMGLQNKEAKRFPDAVENFRRAVDLRQNFPEAWNELGNSLRQSGQYSEALKAYERALQLRPNFPEALEYLGETYVKMGRPDEAEKILERLRSLDATHARELEAAIQVGK
jgi:tetratricopeptide (TPR) repeat protein